MPPLPSSSTSKLHSTVLMNQQIFDPWNSSSSGHQKAENPYSNTTEWRQTRTEKLSRQFRGQPVDGSRDGSHGNKSNKETGEWRWLSAEEAKRKELGCEDIRTLMGGVKKRKLGEDGKENISGKNNIDMEIVQMKPLNTSSIRDSSKPQQSSETQTRTQSNRYMALPPTSARGQLAFCGDNSNDKESTVEQEQPKRRGIFSGITVYVNGSTFPLISDHKLKHLLASNGANIAITLGRRSVTHVILGTPSGKGVGAGGGLAAGKLQKEIQKVGGKGVKFVGVEWVLESLKASERLPEAGFSNLHMASKGQASVLNMFKRKTGPQ